MIPAVDDYNGRYRQQTIIGASIMQRALKSLNSFELVLANVSLLLLVAMLALQVFFRYVLETGLSWSEELSRFCFVWFVYISASLAAQKGTHIRVTVLTSFFPGGQRYCLLLADTIWIVFNACVVVAGILLLQRMFKHPIYSTSLFLPLSYVYAVIPISHALMIIRIIQRQWATWSQGISAVAGEQ